jgi:hypothetical protein
VIAASAATEMEENEPLGAEQQRTLAVADRAKALEDDYRGR